MGSSFSIDLKFTEKGMKKFAQSATTNSTKTHSYSLLTVDTFSTPIAGQTTSMEEGSTAQYADKWSDCEKFEQIQIVNIL
jgi:hypothetical protein